MKIINFFGKVISLSMKQIISILWIFFVFGYVMFLLEKSTTTCLFLNIGWNGVLITGILGTPIHESGHAIFCYIFKHRINQIQFFSPDYKTGVLCYVNHSYNPNNLYEQVGNLFIGMGPLIFGPVIILLLLFILLPESGKDFREIMKNSFIDSKECGTLGQIKLCILNGFKMLKSIFKVSNFSKIRFWIFLYLCFSISSHTALSPADLNGVFAGFVALFIIFLGVNFVFLLFRVNIGKYINKVSKIMIFFGGLYIFTIMMSLINFSLTYAVFGTYYKLRNGCFLNPFI